MINVGSSIKGQLSSYSLTAITCLEINFSASDVMLLTDAPRDITIGAKTYESSDSIRALSAPQAHTDFDRDNYTVSFIDGNHAIRDKFAGKTGIPLQVGVTFLTDDGQLTELIQGYRGFSSAIQSGEEEGTLVTTVAFTGQLSQLDSNSPRVTTERSQEPFNAADTAFKYVHDAANQASIKWGKK